MSDQSLLEVRGLETFYGKIQALKGVDIDIREGEIVTLIGANGAGKTTLMMTICGNPRARSGQVRFAGRDITRLPTHEIMHGGLALSPEGRRIFPRMTVTENLQMGAILNKDAATTFDEDVARMQRLFPILRDRADQRAGTMSGGEQQMLAIARALMGRPSCSCSTSPRSASRP